MGKKNRTIQQDSRGAASQKSKIHKPQTAKPLKASTGNPVPSKKAAKSLFKIVAENGE
jgi:hypothetical protein